MGIKKILWLDDQYEDLGTFWGAMFRNGYFVETVKSVSEFEEKIKNEEFIAYIFDLKVLAGEDEKWINLDNQKREKNPHIDSNLGLELLYSLLAPEKAAVKLDFEVRLDPLKIIVFSVVYDKNEEFIAMGIPKEQIINKSHADLSTLPKLIRKIEERK